MITRNLLLLVSLCLSAGAASASKILRRRGVGGAHVVKLSDSRAAVQWDASVDTNAMPVVTLRNLISPEQPDDTGSISYSKMLQSHAAANKERQAFKPKREVESVKREEATPHVLTGNKKVKNNTKTVDSAARTGKTFTAHHKLELHSNKTRFKSGPRSRSRPDLSVHTTGVPGRGFNADANRKLNLTGVLKLLSKENLVRIVNSQMQNVPNLSYPSKGSRGRKRDLIDVNHGQLEALKLQRQDIAVTQWHTGFDNQTAFPYVSPATTPDHNQEPRAGTRVNPISEVLSKRQDDSGSQGSDGGDTKNKHVLSLSTPRSEVNHSPGMGLMMSHTELPFTSTKQLPAHFPSEANDSPSSVLTMQPMGVRQGNRAADSHRDPLTESVHTAQIELSTPQYPTDEDEKLVNSSHVLRLHPAPEWGPDAEVAEIVDPENAKGLVFEEAEPEVEEEALDRVERTGSRSRSRRSWIWNQFFVIEEYAGPEPVLIGRVRRNFHLSFIRGCELFYEC